MKYPGHYSVWFVMNHANDSQVELGGKYVPARPLGWQSWTNRFRLAWAVFTGRMDALEWPDGQ
jgi:hypothetical protein